MNTCGARTKGTGTPCRRLPCRNGRCKLHGGLSTGPKTAEGRRRCAEVNWKHGQKSKEAIEERRRFRVFLRDCDALLCAISG